MTDITELTRNPVTALANDPLSESDYRDIFAELRQQISLDKLVALVGSEYSKAQWSKYERGQAPLTVAMRNELRAAVGMNQLPPSVQSALSDIDPNGTVYKAGKTAPDAAFMWSTSEYTHIDSKALSRLTTRPTRATVNRAKVSEMPLYVLRWKIANREVYEYAE